MSKQRKQLIVMGCLAVLVAVYVLQRFSYAAMLNAVLPAGMQVTDPQVVFIINKTIRLIINDTTCLVMIAVLFPGRAHRQVAGYIFAVELFIILPVYLFVKLHFEGVSEISSPLLSHVHRLIVNPLLMFLLMIAFLYQKITRTQHPAPDDRSTES